MFKKVFWPFGHNYKALSNPWDRRFKPQIFLPTCNPYSRSSEFRAAILWFIGIPHSETHKPDTHHFSSKFWGNSFPDLEPWCSERPNVFDKNHKWKLPIPSLISLDFRGWKQYTPFNKITIVKSQAQVLCPRTSGLKNTVWDLELKTCSLVSKPETHDIWNGKLPLFPWTLLVGEEIWSLMNKHFVLRFQDPKIQSDLN